MNFIPEFDIVNKTNYTPVFNIVKPCLKRRSDANDNPNRFSLQVKYSTTSVVQISIHYSITKCVVFQRYHPLTDDQIQQIRTTMDENVQVVEDWKLIEKILIKTNTIETGYK